MLNCILVVLSDNQRTNGPVNAHLTIVGGSGGCDPRIEVIVKLTKMSVVGGGVGGGGRGQLDMMGMNHQLKLL